MNHVRRIRADVSAAVPLAALAVLLALLQALLAGRALAATAVPPVRFAICRGAADRSAPVSPSRHAAEHDALRSCALACASPAAFSPSAGPAVPRPLEEPADPAPRIAAGRPGALPPGLARSARGPPGVPAVLRSA